MSCAIQTAARDPARRGIDVDFDHRGGIGVGRRRADASALVLGRERGGVYEPVVPIVPNFASARQTARSKSTPRDGSSPSKTRRSANTSRSFGRRASRQPLRRGAARALGRLDRRVAHHQRDAAGVGAEIDRRQIGVAGDGADVERIDAEHLRDARHQHIVRSLADLRGAAERPSRRRCDRA